tara:strand:+ start:315 stop:602 length:288 start_codon:yes stop_codon:yes gene_type:complete
MNKLESKLKDLNQMLIDDGYNGSNIVIQTLEEIREEAINYTRCCEELKDKKKLNYEEWKFSQGLRYMSDFTYKNAKGKLFESEDLVKMYEAYKNL